MLDNNAVKGTPWYKPFEERTMERSSGFAAGWYFPSDDPAIMTAKEEPELDAAMQRLVEYDQAEDPWDFVEEAKIERYAEDAVERLFQQSLLHGSSSR